MLLVLSIVVLRIVSLYDLMAFADLIQTEEDLRDYLVPRMKLNNQKDVLFFDELDILGFFLRGNFPMTDAAEGEVRHVIGFKEDIDAYFDMVTVGLPRPPKPIRIRK